MAGTVRVTLGGPRAPVWYASLPSAVADALSVNDPDAQVWVVDASAPVPPLPARPWVVLFGTLDPQVLRAAGAGLPGRASLVMRTDLDWLPGFVQALDAGAPPWVALSSVSGTLEAGEPLLAAAPSGPATGGSPPEPFAPPDSVSAAPDLPRRTRSLPLPDLGGLIEGITRRFRTRSADAGGRAAAPSPTPPRSSPPPPPPPPPEPPQAPPATAGADEAEPELELVGAVERHLVTEFWVGAEPRRTVLPPASEVVLEVKIAVPQQGEVAASEPIDVPSEEGRDTVLLDVVASGTPWDAPQTQQISVPTGDPTASSTSAAFTLTTPGSGGVVDIQLMVLYRGRPLQVASLAAAVRATALPSDRMRLLVRTTTSGPMPVLPPATPPESAAPPEGAAVARTLLGTGTLTQPQPEFFTLDADGAELVRTQTGAKVPLTDVDDVLHAMGHTLSQVLGASDAPEDLEDPQARALLVGLARQGAQLRERLAPLGLDGADEISLVVHPHTTLFPLELVYAGPAPKPTASVCRGHRSGAAHPCSGPSRGIVCPLAFWGTSKAVCRTFLRDADDVPPPPPRGLSLASILYGAASRADGGAPADARPTKLLEEAARVSARGQFTAVTSWTGWRKAVRELHPTLMLLLAHTEEVPQEFLLEIGEKSRLSSVDLDRQYLTADPDVSPLVVLVACATALASSPFGSFHGAITARGAAAVVGTLGKLNGPQGARAAAAVLASLQDATTDQVRPLGEVLMDARRDLIGQGLLVGLLLASHGEINTIVEA